MVGYFTASVMKPVGAAIAEYAFGKVGDKFCDTFSAKRKIKRILSDDRKFVEKQFKNQKLASAIDVSDIEVFLFQDIFQDAIFLYPVSDIPKDRAALLWERFCNFVRDKHHDIDLSLLEQEYKFKLEACINNHNELVNKYLLSESEQIILKTIHRNQSDLLGYIGKTLDSNSELQFEDYKLDYTHKQIEGILHALRMDMRHYKFLLMLYSMGILIIELVSIIMLPKTIDALRGSLYEQPATTSLVILLILVLIFTLLLILFFSTMRKVHDYEERISKYMECLWYLHFTSYRIQFESLFESDYDNKFHVD